MCNLRRPARKRASSLDRHRAETESLAARASPDERKCRSEMSTAIDRKAAQMTERSELRTATDETIDDAVRHGDPMALRGLLYQLTGDESIAATEAATVIIRNVDLNVVKTIYRPSRHARSPTASRPCSSLFWRIPPPRIRAA